MEMDLIAIKKIQEQEQEIAELQRKLVHRERELRLKEMQLAQNRSKMIVNTGLFGV